MPTPTHCAVIIQHILRRLMGKPPYPAGVVDYRISGDLAESPLLGMMRLLSPTNSAENYPYSAEIRGLHICVCLFFRKRVAEQDCIKRVFLLFGRELQDARFDKLFKHGGSHYVV